MTDIEARPFSFWRWLVGRSKHRAGVSYVLNRWIILHVAVGLGLSLAVPANIKTAAEAVALPLVGVLVGLTFAWAGNANAMLSSPTMARIARAHSGGIATYAYVYQLAVLTILVTLAAWGLGALGVFDETWPTPARCRWYTAVKALLFTLTSLTVREAWHTVLGAHWMLIAKGTLDEAERIAATTTNGDATPVSTSSRRTE